MFLSFAKKTFYSAKKTFYFREVSLNHSTLSMRSHTRVSIVYLVGSLQKRRLILGSFLLFFSFADQTSYFAKETFCFLLQKKRCTLGRPFVFVLDCVHKNNPFYSIIEVTHGCHNCVVCRALLQKRRLVLGRPFVFVLDQRTQNQSLPVNHGGRTRVIPVCFCGALLHKRPVILGFLYERDLEFQG